MRTSPRIIFRSKAAEKKKKKKNPIFITESSNAVLSTQGRPEVRTAFAGIAPLMIPEPLNYSCTSNIPTTWNTDILLWESLGHMEPDRGPAATPRSARRSSSTPPALVEDSDRLEVMSTGHSWCHPCGLVLAVYS